MEPSPDLLFEFEDEEHEPHHKSVSSGSLNVDAFVKRMELATRLPTPLARQLHADVVSERHRLLKSDADGISVPDLAKRLAHRGYDVTIRVALGGAGSDCFKSLRHEFLVVHGTGEFAGMEFIVEPFLRQHFAVPHPSPEYAFALASTPDVFVGGSCRLVSIIQLLCALMADSFGRQRLPLPPWRREEAMISKWLPNPARTYDLKPKPSAGATPTAVPALATCAPASAEAAPVHASLGRHLSGSAMCASQSYTAAAAAAAAASPSCECPSMLPAGPTAAAANSPPDDAASPLVFVPAPNTAVATPGGCQVAPAVAVTGFALNTQDKIAACGGASSKTGAPAPSAASDAAGDGPALRPCARVSDFDCGSLSQERSLDASSILATSSSNNSRSGSSNSIDLMEELCARAHKNGACRSATDSGCGAGGGHQASSYRAGYRTAPIISIDCSARIGRSSGQRSLDDKDDEDDVLRCLLEDDEEEEEGALGGGAGEAQDPLGIECGGSGVRPPRLRHRETETGMLPGRGPGVGLLAVRLVFGDLAAGCADLEAAPLTQEEQEQGEGMFAPATPGEDREVAELAAVGQSCSGRADGNAPAMRQTRAVPVRVRTGWPEMCAQQWPQHRQLKEQQWAAVAAAAATFPQQQLPPHRQEQWEHGDHRSWLPWTLPCRH